MLLSCLPRFFLRFFLPFKLLLGLLFLLLNRLRRLVKQVESKSETETHHLIRLVHRVVIRGLVRVFWLGWTRSGWLGFGLELASKHRRRPALGNRKRPGRRHAFAEVASAPDADWLKAVRCAFGVVFGVGEAVVGDVGFVEGRGRRGADGGARAEATRSEGVGVGAWHGDGGSERVCEWTGYRRAVEGTKRRLSGCTKL